MTSVTAARAMMPKKAGEPKDKVGGCIHSPLEFLCIAENRYDISIQVSGLLNYKKVLLGIKKLLTYVHSGKI